MATLYLLTFGCTCTGYGDTSSRDS